MTLSELKQLIIKLERIPGYEDGYIVLNEGSQTISIHKDNCENCPKIGKICAYTSISENMRNTLTM